MPEFFPPLFDGTLRAHYLLLFSVAGGIALTAGAVSAWLGARFGAKRAVHRELDAMRASELPARAEERLARLSESVDAIAIEIERIAEAQRFSAKLLAERGVPAPAPRKEPGQITPH